MKKRQVVILGIAFFILAGSVAAAVFLGGQKEEREVKKTPVVKRYVSTEKVSYEDVKTVIKAFGRVETAQSLDLLSEISGRMFQGNVNLKAGTNFRKGELLFYVDAAEATLSLKSQKSEFLKSLAAILPDLKMDYAETYSKWEMYFSNINIDKQLPELPAVASDKEKTFLATKGIFSSYYNIKSAEVRLAKHYYYAPFDGSIAEVTVESGSYINTGSKIGRIIKAGQHELKVSVDTRDVPWIAENSECEVYSEETQQVWNAYVSRVSDFVNQNTQSIDVYLTIQSSKDKIYDGQFLEASIPGQVIKDGMIIPRNAIYNTNEVFVLEDTLLKRKSIAIHRVIDNEAVFSGLTEGQELVVEPLVNAYNNMVAYKLKEKDIDLEIKASAGKELSKTAAVK